MSDTTPKPVIFLAFANDRDDTVGYLRNLPVEARRLREVLEPAEQAGLCEVVVRSNSSAADLFKVFQNPKFRNRVAIFHYSGHANGYQLLLESPEGKAAAADAGGLAAFLAQQQGLQLVFLNGCSTQQQTQELHDANVSVVISTSRAIDDKVATDFADLFYQGLAGGANLLTAYNEASAAVKTTKGGDLRALYFGDADKPEDHRNKKGFPWNLYPREGAENADQWSLPNAVNDPLFGLPPLPAQDLPESPYRHLNWFTREHAEIFFGRGHQIRELYNLLTAGTQPIILFYGQSGVGKSSLLDAGLLPRLERDYEVRYARRGAGGLLATLQSELLSEATDMPIETAWLTKEEQLHKPLIMFLDQVEEFYTRPIKELPDELEQLLQVLKATFSNPSCRPTGKLVLGFRKEWLAELEAQLVAYELPRTKVFLEPLDRRGIIEIVRGPARSARLRERFGLTIEDGLPEIIADNLLEDRGSAIAPTLQILLTKMWAKATEDNYEHPRFSQELYQHLKRDGLLLRDFLSQQIAAFRQRYPDVVNSGLLLDIVALHTTPLGTSDQRTDEQLQQQYAHLSATLSAILQQCQDLYLLTVATSANKESTKTTRLAHDTLAPIVREQFDHSDKPGQRARRILDSRSVDWASGAAGTPLDEADLKVVELGIVGTRVFNSTEQRLVEASRELRARLQRSRKILKIAASAAALVIIVVAGVAVWKSRVANEEKEKALIAKRDSQIARNDALEQAEKADRAARIAECRRLITLATVQTNLPQRRALLAYRSLLTTNQDKEGCLPESIEILGHSLAELSGSVLSFNKVWKQVQFRADESSLLTLSKDGSLECWDLSTIDSLERPRTLNESGPSVERFWDSPDSESLITANSNNSVSLFRNLGVSYAVQTVPNISGEDLSVVFLSDETNGPVAVLHDSSAAVSCWDLRGERPRESTLIVATPPQKIVSIQSSPKGKWLLTIADNATAKVWRAQDLWNGIPSRELNDVAYADFSDDDTRVAWITTAGTQAQLVELNDSESVPKHVALPPLRKFFSVKFTPDAAWLVFSGPPTVSLVRTPRHEDPSKALQLENRDTWMGFSSDGRWLATNEMPFVQGVKPSVCLFDLQKLNSTNVDFKIPGMRERELESFEISPDGHWLATYPRNSNVTDPIRLWDLSSPDPTTVKVSDIQRPERHFEKVKFLGDKEKTSWLLSSHIDGVVQAVPIPLTDNQESLKLLGHERLLSRSFDALHVSANQRWMLTVSDTEPARLWDFSAEQLGESSIAFLSSASDPTFASHPSSFDGWVLARAKKDGVRFNGIFGVERRELTLQAHSTEVLSVLFSHRGSFVASGSEDGTVCLWDVSSTEPKRKSPVWSAHSNAVEALAVSADDRWLATGAADGEVCRSDLTKDPPTKITVGNQKSKVHGLAFSPSGRWLVSTGVQSGEQYGKFLMTGHIWDMEARDGKSREVHWFMKPDGTAVGLVGDFPFVLLARSESEERGLTEIVFRDLAKHILRKVGRDMYPHEWQSFFPDQTYEAVESWPQVQEP